MASNAKTALPPMGFRFTHESDIAAYGDQWFTYDETEIMLLPVEELIFLEESTDAVLVDIMNGIRASSVLGELCGSWIALRMHDEKLAGEFKDYRPMVKWIEWGPAPKKESLPEEDRPTVENSEKPDTVALHPLLPSDSDT